MKTNSAKFSLYNVMCYALAFIVSISFSLYMTEFGYSSILLATMLSIMSGMLLVIRFLIPRIINTARCHLVLKISTLVTILILGLIVYLLNKRAFYYN